MRSLPNSTSYLIRISALLRCFIFCCARCSIGRNIRFLIERPDEEYCFRLHNDRVFYLSERLMKEAASVARDQLVRFFLLVSITCVCCTPLTSPILCADQYGNLLWQVHEDEKVQIARYVSGLSGSIRKSKRSAIAWLPYTAIFVDCRIRYASTSCGSSLPARCPICTATTFSKRISVVSPRTLPSIKASSCFPCQTCP